MEASDDGEPMSGIISWQLDWEGLSLIVAVHQQEIIRVAILVILNNLLDIPTVNLEFRLDRVELHLGALLENGVDGLLLIVLLLVHDGLGVRKLLAGALDVPVVLL